MEYKLTCNDMAIAHIINSIDLNDIVAACLKDRKVEAVTENTVCAKFLAELLRFGIQGVTEKNMHSSDKENANFYSQGENRSKPDNGRQWAITWKIYELGGTWHAMIISCRNVDIDEENYKCNNWIYTSTKEVLK
jgi:hypothetical protein